MIGKDNVIQIKLPESVLTVDEEIGLARLVSIAKKGKITYQDILDKRKREAEWKELNDGQTTKLHGGARDNKRIVIIPETYYKVIIYNLARCEKILSVDGNNTKKEVKEEIGAIIRFLNEAYESFNESDR